MTKRVLGFDVSSSCIGYCALDFDIESQDIKYIKHGFYKPNKDGLILDRLMETKIHIAKTIKEYEADEIAIEDIISFMKNKSTAQTVITLAVFNRMVGISAYEALNKAPTLYNVMSIRHGLKLTKELPAKEQMPEVIEKHLGIEFPYQYKIKRKTKEKVIAVESYDMADAFSVALYHARLACKLIIKKVKK